MSRNYDNWERLVAAVVKREQIWQLCHQDSISTVSSSDYSYRGLDSSLAIADTFEFLRRLSENLFWTTDLVRVLQDVQVPEQRYLATGTKVVIKSLKIEITEDEFEQHMIAWEDCRHENVVTPLAYHFSEMAKLIVYDYYSRGSVLDRLRENSWERCVRIVIGAARGIAHIHTQCGGEMVHGNIKLSNIFINRRGNGCVSDFGLAGIVERPQRWRRRASEDRVENLSQSQKSDVYSFGLLLIAFITGRPAMEAFDVVQSFESYEWEFRSYVVKRICLVDEVAALEERSSIFIDQRRLLGSAVEKLWIKTLEVAKRCSAFLPGDRPPMSQVVSELENILTD